MPGRAEVIVEYTTPILWRRCSNWRDVVLRISMPTAVAMTVILGQQWHTSNEWRQELDYLGTGSSVLAKLPLARFNWWSCPTPDGVYATGLLDDSFVCRWQWYYRWISQCRRSFCKWLFTRDQCRHPIITILRSGGKVCTVGRAKAGWSFVGKSVGR